MTCSLGHCSLNVNRQNYYFFFRFVWFSFGVSDLGSGAMICGVLFSISSVADDLKSPKLFHVAFFYSGLLIQLYSNCFYGSQVFVAVRAVSNPSCLLPEKQNSFQFHKEWKYWSVGLLFWLAYFGKILFTFAPSSIDVNATFAPSLSIDCWKICCRWFTNVLGREYAILPPNIGILQVHSFNTKPFRCSKHLTPTTLC